MPLQGRNGFRRRAVLVAGLSSLVSLAGCESVPDTQGQLSDIGALRPVLQTARTLAGSYQRAVGSGDDAVFGMLRDNHRAHAKMLAKILGESAEDADAIADVGREALEKAESKGFDEVRELCVKAQPDHVLLLGEIAACRAAHLTGLKVR